MKQRAIYGITLAVLLSAVSGFVLGSSTGSDTTVWKADEAFNRALDERNRKAFASWLDEEAVFLGGGLHQGREEILAAWSIYFDRDSDQRLSWQPHTAVVSRCEDVGYTLGDYSSIAPAADGELVRYTGTYLSVWRKGTDGAWHVVADAGTPPVGVTP